MWKTWSCHNVTQTCQNVTSCVGNRVETGGKPGCVTGLHTNPLCSAWEQVGNRVEVSDVDMYGVTC